MAMHYKCRMGFKNKQDSQESCKSIRCISWQSFHRVHPGCIQWRSRPLRWSVRWEVCSKPPSPPTPEQKTAHCGWEREREREKREKNGGQHMRLISLLLARCLVAHIMGSRSQALSVWLHFWHKISHLWDGSKGRCKQLILNIESKYAHDYTHPAMSKQQAACSKPHVLNILHLPSVSTACGRFNIIPSKSHVQNNMATRPDRCKTSHAPSLLSLESS